MKIRVGRMPYLNSDVFYWKMPAAACRLVTMFPRQMAQAVAASKLDAGPLPVADVFRMENDVRPIGDFCVSTAEASVSVLLLSSMPADRLGGARVAVTDETSTSVQLLRVLFAEYWRVQPAKYVTLDQPHEARLLIGDAALRDRMGVAGYPFVHDLGVAWRQHTGLPFVYATWVARRDVDEEALEKFTKSLGKSLEKGMASLGEIISARRMDVGLRPTEIADYIDRFTYRLGAREQEGLAVFRTRLSGLPDWRPGEQERPRKTAPGATARKESKTAPGATARKET